MLVQLTRRRVLTRSAFGAAALASAALLAACGASPSTAATSSVASATSAQTSAVSTRPAVSTSKGASATTSSATTTAAKSAAKTSAAPSAGKAAATPTVNPNALQVWGPWPLASVSDKGYSAALEALKAKQPKVEAVLVTAAYPTKFYAAAAAGTPPDLVFITPAEDLAYKKVVQNLDQYLNTAKLGSSDFFAPGWQQTGFQGHQYALPLFVGPNFPLVYNKDLLQQAGIAKLPATITELDDADQKLFQKQGDTITRLGFYPPWLTYGSTNSLYTYFLMFGGGWYDPTDQTKLAITQPANADALSWIKKYADTFGGYATIQKFAGSWGNGGYNGNSDALGRGQLAMAPIVPENYIATLTVAKGGAFATSFALAPMPVVQGVKADPAWVGGWGMSIPAGVKHVDASWTVLQWMAADPTGTDTWAEINGNLPGYKKSPFYSKHATDPNAAGFIQVLQGAQHPHSLYRLGWSDIPGKAFDDLLNNTVQGKTDVSTALQQFETVVTGTLSKYKAS